MPLGALKNTALLRDYHAYRGLIFIAVALALAMALLSPTNKQVHHDEYDHVNAARFYFHHWLPPAVGDSRTLDSYSVYGMSYLNEWDVVYFIAGKFAAVLKAVLRDDVIALRLFNVTLFFLLACVSLARRELALPFAILLTSPQIWYLFSYFNGDAFPLFLSFLAVAILTSPRSSLAQTNYSAVKRYIPLAACVGLLLVSKKTFWAFGLFAVLYAVVLEFDARRPLLQGIKNVAALAALICAVAAPRIAYDLHINDTPTQKAANIQQTAEVLAAPMFKPSTGQRSLMNLKSKGVGLRDLMRPSLGWHTQSAITAFGAYNYATVVGGSYYYAAIITIYALFLAYLVLVILKRSSTSDKLVLLGAFALSCMIVGVAVYHAWVNDFQAQGRYLFAMFPILAVIIARNRAVLNPSMVNLFFLFCFALSLYSFVLIGLGNASEFGDLLEINPEFRRPD